MTKGILSRRSFLQTSVGLPSVMWEIKTPWRSSRRPGPSAVDHGQRDGVLVVGEDIAHLKTECAA